MIGEALIWTGAAILWLAAGAASFVYWWTRDHDLTTRQVLLPLLFASSGPVAFLLGWLIHGKPLLRERVLVRRRCERG